MPGGRHVSTVLAYRSPHVSVSPSTRFARSGPFASSRGGKPALSESKGK